MSKELTVAGLEAEAGNLRKALDRTYAMAEALDCLERAKKNMDRASAALQKVGIDSLSLDEVMAIGERGQEVDDASEELKSLVGPRFDDLDSQNTVIKIVFREVSLLGLDDLMSVFTRRVR